MRPVKKSLKALDSPDQTLSAQDQEKQMMECLMHIGQHIDKCLAEMQDPEKMRVWRK